MTKSLSYRADIQGLRAIAVILVLLFHFETRVQGGYLGVDMFFVISGFVLNLSNRDQIISGKVSFRNYFVKRFRRIYPVLVASMILAYLASCLAKGEIIPVVYK